MVYLAEEDYEKRLHREMEFLQRDIHNRLSSTWVVNSILITASILVVFQSEFKAFPTPLVAILLLLISFILTATSDKINGIYHERLTAIRHELKIPDLYENEIKGRWWYSLRTNAQYLLYASLACIYLYVAQKPFLSLVLFILGTVAISIREIRAYVRRETRK